MISRELVRALLLISCFFGLVGNFYCNSFRLTDDRWFLFHQHDTESLVIGRLVKSRQDGMFSSGGLLGAGIDADLHRDWITALQTEQQYQDYLRSTSQPTVYSPYLSQPGAQGLLFGVLDASLPLPAYWRLETLYALNSLLTAAVMTAIVWWFFLELGWSAALAVALSIFFSQWIIVFGRNLWWNIWAFYLPMVALMVYLRRRREQEWDSRATLRAGAVVFAAMLVKCLFNGYEYITTTLVMATVPLFYEAVRRGWTLRRFAPPFLALSAAACLAIAVSLVILLLQISAVKGGFAAGFDHLYWTTLKRTHGSSAAYPEYYQAGLGAATVRVLRLYLEGNFFAMKWTMVGRDSTAWWSAIRLPYAALLGLVAAASLAAAAFLRARPDAPSAAREPRALLLATWISLLAPVSWFVIFKAHSFVHVHMNFIVWQMPFTLFAAALAGWLVQAAISRPRPGA